MTRPNILRADTIDLQDKDTPTASEHQKPVIQNGLAPHQRAEVHHVLEERTSEENALADAWERTSTWGEAPDAIEQAQAEHNTEPETNGAGKQADESEAEGEDDMLDRISSSPSIDDEDIDFEFVYALHTFVATVEGQANATKGDTMVLLDDSNSYWWLVRVVKDSSIGYLPAEHIETPTERLARLNKHRNIDLSATMLSDNSEKSRNPIKKAMRRRNAKTVQFSAPTYVEASDYYDTEDEEDAAVEPSADAQQAQNGQQNGDSSDADSSIEKRSSLDDSTRSATPNRDSFDREQAAVTHANATGEISPKLVDKSEAAPLKSRKTRNTDSFLKDDSLETRKITLTPGLLREDGTSPKSSEDSRSNSLESIVKQISPPEQLNKKDSKKDKEKKKGGLLGGLFKSKKKDKKAQDEIASQGDVEKTSSERSRESPIVSPLTSGRNSPGTDATSPMSTRGQMAPSREPSRSKLQKQPPVGTSSPQRELPQEQQAEIVRPSQDDATHYDASAPVAELEGSETAHEMASTEPEQLHTELTAQDKQKAGALSPITNLLKRDDSKAQKPEKAKRSKQRIQLDDFDTPAAEDGPNPFEEQEERAAAMEDSEDDSEHLSESPVEITQDTFMHATESVHIPTPSPYDQPDVSDDEEEPESLTSSPSIIEHPSEETTTERADTEVSQEDSDRTPTGPRSPSQAAEHAMPQNPASATRDLSADSNTTTSSRVSPSTISSSQQSWSDSSLRAWLDDGSDVRDMMVMIHDKSSVVPAGDDHPLMAGLFKDERKGVQDMMGQLDGLLGSYLQRKGIAFG